MKVTSTKVIFLLYLLLALPSALKAQDARVGNKEPADITVLKFTWIKERLPGWENNPFGQSFETYDAMVARVGNERRLAQARNTGNKGEVARQEREAKQREDATKPKTVSEKTERPRDGYKYKLVVKNQGTKTIKLVDWDYVFFDKSTGEEISRRQFTSEEKISPGKEKELVVFILSPPVGTVAVNSVNKKEQDLWVEQVVLMRIEYSDHSLWERPAN